ncbi:FixG Ig-like domain-containing protein, partial [Campylobacter upsaliensis]
QTREKVNYFRFRTIAYAGVLTIALIALFVMGSRKENMLLNINRSTELYSIKHKNNVLQITNAYTFLFQNTDSKPHEYYFEAILEGVENGVKILRPTKPFKLEAGAKDKKIIVLEALKELANDNQKDTIFSLKIKAYALDDPNIVVYRESIFVYPKSTLLKGKNGE